MEFYTLIVLGAVVGFTRSTTTTENVYLLESYPSYSLLLPLLNEGHWNETFVVQSPRFHRVMAVIQFLNLPPRNDFTCGTFLQFQDGADKFSEKICGNFDPEEKSFSPSSLIGPRSYISSRDRLKVSLMHTTSGKLDKSYARISFTAFRDDCYFVQPRNWTGGLPRYRPCEYAVSSDGIGRQCIVTSLFCNNVIDCGPTDSTRGTDFGQDESELNCPHLYTQPVSSVTSNSVEEESSDSQDSTFKTLAKSDEQTTIKRFFDEREEHLANMFKSAIIGFIGICTLCILFAFIISIFCLGKRYSRTVRIQQ